MKNIIEKIKASYQVSDEAIDRLKEHLEICSFPKKTLLVEVGKPCRQAYFIEKGMTRSYWIVNGEEITTSFSWEGSIVFSMDAMYYGQPSEEYVETVEDVTAYRISIDGLTGLFRTDIGLANWGRIIHQDEYRRLHRSHKERLALPEDTLSMQTDGSCLHITNYLT
ncbi:MAG: cyclic nucleotide-binding domain-containing protein [Bacteroidales bacterium]|nr:cyclic nucleotide-binding domain-containing protein [Bacteroidales bacterium]